VAIGPEIQAVTERIVKRSKTTRTAYLDRVRRAASRAPNRAHLGCGNQAHAYAAMGDAKDCLAEGRAPNIGIVTAYNDMLSAHQPFANYPQLIKEVAAAQGATAQVAGGVPAMCDGVTQGQIGMELSLFSRDTIALAAAVALSHDTYDAAVYLGVCDKIVPGLVMAAATFGHLPAIFIPAGPMTSGLPNDEKSRIRERFAAGEIDRKALMTSEMAAYHGPGTCTFYGTANSNQMLMEIMGLHLPGASFVNPGTPLRDAMTRQGTRQVLARTTLGNDYMPVADILDEKAFVNGIVGLMATGGSTNLVIHLIAMARATGIALIPDDFACISDQVPLLARVYPNGLADVNHFHAAGGLAFVIGELLAAGLLHSDVQTIAGFGLGRYTREPFLTDDDLEWRKGPVTSANDKILRRSTDPFQSTGGLRVFRGNLGEAIMKVSAVSTDHMRIAAPARVFTTQDEVKTAFRAGALDQDVVVVVRFQGPQSNGMPELHGLTPMLSVLLDRGHKVALVTDGRMSGASGKVPAVIHVSPEASEGGAIARIRDGDIIVIDAETGLLEARTADLDARPLAQPAAAPTSGLGRELFQIFRQNVGGASAGASAIL